MNNGANNKKNDGNESKIQGNESKIDEKTKNSSFIEENQLKKETQNLGSKIVEVVANNQKALKLLKKRKYQVWTFDPTNECSIQY